MFPALVSCCVIFQSDNNRAVSPEDLYEAVGNPRGVKSAAAGDVIAGDHSTGGLSIWALFFV